MFTEKLVCDAAMQYVGKNQYGIQVWFLSYTGGGGGMRKEEEADLLIVFLEIENALRCTNEFGNCTLDAVFWKLFWYKISFWNVDCKLSTSLNKK